MSRRGKIILIVAILAIIGIIAALVFWPRSAPSGTEPQPTPRFGFLPESIANLLNGGKPSASRGPATPTPLTEAGRLRQRLYPISQDSALAAALGPSGDSIRYFSRSTGILWQSDFEGLHLSKLADAPVKNIISTVWAPGGEQAILFTQEPSEGSKAYLYVIGEKRLAELNHFIRSVAFSPQGDRIIYHYLNTTNGDNLIAVAKPDGSNFKTLYRPAFTDFSLYWPRPETAVIETKPSYASKSYVYTLDARNGVLNKVLPQDYYGADAVFSPSGTRLMISQVSDSGELQHGIVGSLSVFQPRDLFAIKTLAEKCVWRKDNVRILCAVPSATPPIGTLLPDAYYQGVYITADDVQEVNIDTLAIRTIARSQELYPVFDLTSPVLASDESRVFFINRQDGLLYALRLAP